MSLENEKESRTRAIFRLIKERAISTQAGLVEALNEAGFEVTQATISRDVRSLGLVKVPLAGGGYRYAPPSGRTAAREQGGFSLGSFVLSVAEAEAFCVVNTLPGRAMAVAITIDELGLPEVVGTLAGDDLVLVMIAESNQKSYVQTELKNMFQKAKS